MTVGRKAYYLNRLILHERDNPEDQAVKERRSTESVWNEAIVGSRAETPLAPEAGERQVAVGILEPKKGLIACPRRPMLRSQPRPRVTWAAFRRSAGGPD